MACCLMVPLPWLIWRLISEVPWYLPDINFTASGRVSILHHKFQNHNSEITTTSPKSQWVRTSSVYVAKKRNPWSVNMNHICSGTFTGEYYLGHINVIHLSVAWPKCSTALRVIYIAFNVIPFVVSYIKDVKLINLFQSFSIYWYDNTIQSR